MCRRTLRCQQATSFSLMVVAVVLITVALVTRGPIQSYIENMIKQQVVLQPGTDAFDQWSDPPVPIYDDMYLFNLTNPEDFVLGAKANLVVVGPFVYRKKVIKAQANVTGDLKYAVYFDKESFYYEEELTKEKNPNGSLSDKIYIPNIPLITVISQLNHLSLSDIIKEVLEAIIEDVENDHNLTTYATIEDILWGMDDPIMKTLYELGLAPSEQFGLQVNGSTDPNAMTKPTIIGTGHDNISQIGQYYRYHGKNSSGCWLTNAANVINGTEGTMFEPLLYLRKTASLGIYNDQLYRSVVLEYTNDSSYNNIDCYLYQIPKWALENSTLNPTNAAYYANVYTGVLNLTKCMDNAPMYITKAMFLDADVRLLENVTLSVTANRSLHETYLCVEPNVGVTIDAHKRVQINVQIEHHNVSVMNNVLPAFIPALYIDEHGSITPDLSAKLKTSLLLPISISKWGPYVVCGVGAFIGLMGITLCAVILANDYRAVDSDKTSLIVPESYTSEDDTPQLEHSTTSDAYLSIDGRNSRYYEASN